MDLKDMVSIGVMFVVVVIALGIGASITNTVRESQCASGSTLKNASRCCSAYNATSDECNQTYTYAYNISTQGLTGLSGFGSWLPIIAIAVIATVIIGIIMKGFGGISGI
jgi:hypothetical protein